MLQVKDLNIWLKGKEPWQIVTMTTASVLMSIWIWNTVFQAESLYERSKKKAFRLLRKLPFVAKKVKEETEKVYELYTIEMKKRAEDVPYSTVLPDLKGDADKIQVLAEKYFTLGKYKWKEGYVSGTVYYYDEKLTNLITEVNRLASYTNPLHPDVFPGVCKMEAEIIKMVVNLFHGTEDGCGSMTSGGTESIFMACKAYRDYAKDVRGVKYPEILAPKSAHAAFDKAGSYLRVQLRHIKLDEETWSVDIKAMERAISKNTIMLVGSAPNFPYGTMDNIEEIARLGRKYNIPVHVDCCLGSFIVAFMPSVGYDVPKFDFQVPGVTSISVDTHKYGFAPKGSSVIMYSELKYRHYQYYVSLSWPGGLYGSPTVGGSRSGAVIATCWATLMYFGKEGYAEAVKQIVTVSKYIENELREVPGIFIFGKPLSTVIAIGSHEFHIYRLCHALNKRGWNLNMLQFPFGIHICITQLHTQPGVADAFLNDVKVEVENILATPNTELEGTVAMYGMSTTLPDRTIVGDFTKRYLDAIYYTPKTTEVENF